MNISESKIFGNSHPTIRKNLQLQLNKLKQSSRQSRFRQRPTSSVTLQVSLKLAASILVIAIPCLPSYKATTRVGGILVHRCMSRSVHASVPQPVRVELV